MKSRKIKLLVVGIFFVAFFSFFWGTKANCEENKFPTKPIEIIVNYPAGGPTDVPTRIVVDELSTELGVPISIQYKPGAAGMIGATFVSTQKADGHTFLSTSISSIVSAPLLGKTSAYDPLKDFTPIASFVVIPNLLLIHSSSELDSFDAVVEYAKKNPGDLTCSTPGAGTTAHFVIEVLKMHGVDIVPVPSKGGAGAATALLGKHVDMGVFLYSAAIPHVKSGALRMLAATEKVAQEPEVPTLKEKGYPEAEGLGAIMGFVGPANMPKAVTDRIAEATQKVLQIPSIIQALEKVGYTILYIDPDGLTNKFAEDYKSIDKIVKAAGLGKYAK